MSYPIARASRGASTTTRAEPTIAAIVTSTSTISSSSAPDCNASSTAQRSDVVEAPVASSAAKWTNANVSVGSARARSERGRGSRKRPLRGWDSLSPAERAAATRRAAALAGCLIQAAEVLIDELIDDIVSLRAEESAAGQYGAAAQIEDTWVLCQLPARFAARYTPLFAQRLLVAVVDVTGRLTKGWEPLASVAQELGLRILLNLVDIVAETAGVTLDDGWRGHLEEILFEDIDHEMLYNPAYDGIEDDPESQPPGMAPMRFEDWFKPFSDERTMPPYALPRAVSAEPPESR